MSPPPFETLTLETTKRRGCDPFFWKSSPMGLAIIKLRSALEKRLRGGGVPRHAAAFFAPCGAVAVFENTAPWYGGRLPAMVSIAISREAGQWVIRMVVQAGRRGDSPGGGNVAAGDKRGEDRRPLRNGGVSGRTHRALALVAPDRFPAPVRGSENRGAVLRRAKTCHRHVFIPHAPTERWVFAGGQSSEAAAR